MQKKTELFLNEFHSSVRVESDLNTDLIIFSVTEYEVADDYVGNVEVVKPKSTTEIYIDEQEAKEIAIALLETLGEEEVI